MNHVVKILKPTTNVTINSAILKGPLGQPMKRKIWSLLQQKMYKKVKCCIINWQLLLFLVVKWRRVGTSLMKNKHDVSQMKLHHDAYYMNAYSFLFPEIITHTLHFSLSLTHTHKHSHTHTPLKMLESIYVDFLLPSLQMASWVWQCIHIHCYVY
jgi:hypothetical protein